MIRRPQVPHWRRIATPIALAVVSLFAALVLWIAVSDAENPQTTVEVSGVPVRAVNVPEDLAVLSIQPPTVKVFVRADEDENGRLAPADFDVTVDLTNVRETASLGIEAEVVVDEDIDVLGESLQTVRVELEQLASKQVPVEASLAGTAPQGYNFRPEIVPSTATVRGARTLIDLVDHVSADLNVTGLRANLTQQVALVPRDSRGLEIVRVQVEPARAEARITVQQQEITVQLPVVATLQGAVADGYNVVGVSIDPPVSVIGTLETTQALTTVSTEPIDISGLNRDISRSVRLRLPSGVRATRDTVTVTVRIAPAHGEMLLSVAPQVTNLGDGLNATLQTSTLTVRLVGELPALRTIAPGTLRATVDASGRQEGVHVLEAQISQPPAGTQVTSVEPPTVVVVIRR